MNYLVYVPRPRPFESPTSVLIRTAKKNGFLNVHHMTSILLPTGSKRWLDLRLQSGAFFKLMCTEAPGLTEELRQVFYDQPRKHICRSAPILVDGHEVPASSLMKEFRPCAYCIIEGYTRSPQDLNFFDECPYHHAPFITECPACSAHNYWYNINGYSCACGFNFKDRVNYKKAKPFLFALTSSFGQQNVIRSLNKYFDNHILRCSFASSNCHVPTAFFANPLIESLLTIEINTYCKLPLRAFEAPWHNLKNEKLRFEILDFLFQCKRDKTECQSPKCCSTVKLNFSELCYACHVEHRRAREMIRQGVVETITIQNSNEIYYGSPDLCTIIQEELSKPINNSYSKPSEALYLSASQTADRLRTTTTAVLNLISIGVFYGALKNHRAHFIPKTSIDDFTTNYITAGEIAETYRVPSKTVTTLMHKLNIPPILESLSEWIPSIYLRNATNKILTPHLFATHRRHSYKGISDDVWLYRKSKELSLDIRTLKDLLRNHFKWLPPYSTLSSRQTKLIDTWRKYYRSYAEVKCALEISHGIIGTRFSSTNFISPQIWGITNYIHTDDVIRMSDHLEHYFSVSQAAEVLSVGRNTIYSLIDLGMLKTGTPLFSRAQRKIIMIVRDQDAFKLPLSKGFDGQ
ncbi:hypothetical protein ACYZT3_08920 [Pseudomonas sp. MDT1-16]